MSSTKKIWQKPKLIILERGRPEEMVLAGCKMAGSKAKTSNKKSGCMRSASCKLCSAFSTS
ncbi:MAG: hypothetical protein HGA74_10260 [Deltaproteobacteria bacterium]|jgi:hypothetical protein|nr:hypothetical protein [Deltaproteobacteria bacterium]NTV57654.1 hypothetical protein [Deltaproteobacteria bacterium]